MADSEAMVKGGGEWLLAVKSAVEIELEDPALFELHQAETWRARLFITSRHGDSCSTKGEGRVAGRCCGKFACCAWRQCSKGSMQVWLKSGIRLRHRRGAVILRSLCVVQRGLQRPDELRGRYSG